MRKKDPRSGPGLCRGERDQAGKPAQVKKAKMIVMS